MESSHLTRADIVSKRLESILISKFSQKKKNGKLQFTHMWLIEI